MLKLVVNIACVVALGGVAMFANAESILTPKSKKTVKVLAKPSRSAKVISQVKPGESIMGQERKGMYWRVTLKNGSNGYISVMRVKRSAASKGTTLAEAIRNAAEKSRGEDKNSGVRSRSAVMGVRGLNESNDVANAGSVSPNLRMVYAMEDMRIASKDLDRLNELVFSEIEKRVDGENP
jgi:hypothetical protein